MGLLGKKRTVKYWDTLRHQSKDDFARSTDLLNSGVAGLDELDDDIYGQIKAGGLTPEMEREYDVARGRIADDVARSRRGWGADLLQATRRSGGTVDANTALAYQIEREGQLDEAQFDAENEISFEKARTRMARVDAMYGLLTGIRERKLGSAEMERQRAMNGWISAISGRASYINQMTATAASVFTSIAGAGAGSGYGSGGSSSGSSGGFKID